jgi:hypothetical protein
VTVQQALERYEEHLQKKGNRQRSIDTTLIRLRMWFPDGAQMLPELAPVKVAGKYSRRCEAVATAYGHPLQHLPYAF